MYESEYGKTIYILYSELETLTICQGLSSAVSVFQFYCFFQTCRVVRQNYKVLKWWIHEF